MDLTTIVTLSKPIHIADIGASDLGEKPSYAPLLEKSFARLSAFDGDERQKAKLFEKYGDKLDFYSDIIADGLPQTLYLLPPTSGMSSILKPDEKRLAFFNGFSSFNKPQEEISVQSKRLDDFSDLAPIDFLSMDIQGGELMVLHNSHEKLRDCVAIQLEVSFVPLYEAQPSFGEIDTWMRRNGYIPHRFVSIKPWSISPTIRGGQLNIPFNQLMEADIVYIRDPLKFNTLSAEQITIMAYIALYSYASPDLAVYCLLELERRGAGAGLVERFFSQTGPSSETHSTPSQP